MLSRLLLIFALSFLTFLYFFTGFDPYLVARFRISQLPREERSLAFEKLKGVLVSNQSKGILGRVFTMGWGSVLVWTLDGPRLYRVDENSVFAIWNGCDGSMPRKIDNSSEEPTPIKKEIYTDIKIWESKVRSGDLITIVLAGEGNSMNKNIREAWVIDWWSFLPGDMRIQCAK